MAQIKTFVAQAPASTPAADLSFLLGWAMAGEALSVRLVVAMLAILGSIAFIRRGTRQPH